jgi:hypothetical protein
MEPAETTLYLNLPLDLAEEFERCAREERLTEGQLFQRMFGLYLAALESIQASPGIRNSKHLEQMILGLPHLGRAGVRARPNHGRSGMGRVLEKDPRPN